MNPKEMNDVDLRNFIREKWFSSGGMWGPQKFSKKFGVPLNKVREEIKNYDVVQRTKVERQKTIAEKANKILGKPRNNGVTYSQQLDLYDWGTTKAKRMHNEGYRYVLGIIDVYSRRVFYYKLKSKKAKELLPIMEKHFTDFPTQNLTGDRESSWYKNKRWASFCKKNNIKQYFVYSIKIFVN